MHKNIYVFSDKQWPEMSAGIINNAVQAVCKIKGSCSIVLTGGRGAERVYDAWANKLLPGLSLSFYFGDERCLPPENAESNYALAMRSLFKKGVPDQYNILRVYGEATNYEAEAERYGSLLPEEIDILLLSMGEDGHIASVFPGDVAMHTNNKRVAVVSGTKPPNPRITITPRLIAKAQQVFCLACGVSKSNTFTDIFQDAGDVISFPAKLVINGNWLVDRSAAEMIEKAPVVKNKNL